MRRIAWPILFLFAATLCSLTRGEEGASGEVLHIETRPGVRIPLFTAWRSDAVATVVLFSGGGGGYGKLGDDGWPSGGNSLIRTGKLWASHPLNVVMVGRPSDGLDLSDGAVRVGEKHAADNVAIVNAVKLRSPLPIWVVGNSMGTISAASTAIEDKDKLIAGVVLTSSVTSYKIVGAVPRQDLDHIRVPTLIVHHTKDACKACTPYEAKNIAGKLKNAPIKQTILVSEGSGESGDPCEAMHYHGYIGAEKQVVDMIVGWIRNPGS